MGRLIRTFLPSFSGLLVSLACSSGESDDVGQSKFSAELVHAVCDTVVNCCNDAELGFDATTCRRNVLMPFGGQLTSNSVHYDPDAAASCIMVSQRLSESCVEVPVGACANVFRGRLPVGSPCQASYECDSGPLGLGVCGADGLCTWPARGMQGQPCAYSCRSGSPRAECKSVYGSMAPVQTACFEDDGLYCFVPPDGQAQASCQLINQDCRQRLDVDKACPAGYCDKDTGACVPYAPIGGSCATAKCVAEAYCVNALCYPKQPLTAPCFEGAECQSNRCNGGFCTMFSAAAAVMCAGNTN